MPSCAPPHNHLAIATGRQPLRLNKREFQLCTLTVKWRLRHELVFARAWTDATEASTVDRRGHPTPSILLRKLGQPAGTIRRNAAFARIRLHSHPLRRSSIVLFVLFDDDSKQVTDAAVHLARDEIDWQNVVQPHWR